MARHLDHAVRAVQNLRRVPVQRVGLSLTPGKCQIGYMCDQNSTYGLHSLPGGVKIRYLFTWTVPAVISRCFDCKHNVMSGKVPGYMDRTGRIQLVF
jgi:hypothetical protein